MSHGAELYGILEKHIINGTPNEQERALEDAEEAHYMDAALSYQQFMKLSRLFQETTGDHSTLNH